jgi:deoxyinosine 3'endonuclease (endonuclease V)
LLFVAVVCGVVAASPSVGIAKQLEPCVIALVASGDVRGPLAQHRVKQVAGELRAQRDIAGVVTY